MKLRKTWSIDMSIAHDLHNRFRKLGFRDESHLVNYAIRKFLYNEKIILKDQIKEMNWALKTKEERLKFILDLEGSEKKTKKELEKEYAIPTYEF